MNIIDLSKEIQKSYKDITFSICNDTIIFKAVKSKTFGLIVGIYDYDNITEALILNNYKNMDIFDLSMYINSYIKDCCTILDKKFNWINITLKSYDYNKEL